MAFLDSMNGFYNSGKAAANTAWESTKNAANDARNWVADSTGLPVGEDVVSGAMGGPIGRGGFRNKKGLIPDPALATPPAPPPISPGRARISPLGSGINLFGNGAIMEPLQRRNSLVFPYTPTLQVGATAEFEPSNISHTVYKSQSFTKSFVNELVLTAEFTAQTTEEARYMLAAMHFFRSVTKSYFGVQNGALAGSPPPVVKFDYLGDQMFNSVPVVIKGFTYALPPDVDYVIINESNLNTQVPAHITMTITMDVYYNPYVLREVFSVAKFRDGSLLSGGFI